MRQFLVWIIPCGLFAAAGVIAAVYGYPRLYEAVQRNHPDRYRENIDAALALGDQVQALRLARRAARFHKYDPAAWTIYGELLLDAGRTDDARAVFATAVGLDVSPAPDYRETRRPFFFAPARVRLAQIILDEEHLAEGLAQFELSRPAFWIHDAEFAAFKDAAFRAYARAGVWERALLFDEPDEALISSLAPEPLLALARAARTAGKPAATTTACRRLLELGQDAAEAHLLLGRLLLAAHRPGEARQHLEAALAAGHEDAGHFLGEALIETDANAALAAYLTTGRTSPRRPFALAKAYSLLAAGVTTEPGANSTEVREELVRWAADTSLFTLLRRGPATYSPSPLTPEGVAVVSSGLDAEIVVRWKLKRDMAGGAQTPMLIVAGPDNLTLRIGDTVLQWISAPNTAVFPQTHWPPEVARRLPGWYDPDVEWSRRRSTSCADVIIDSEGAPLLEVRYQPGERFPRIQSAPAPVRKGAYYLCAARMRTEGADGVLGWEFLDRRENAEGYHNLFNWVPAPEWEWRAAYAQSQAVWEEVQLIAGAVNREGRALFSDIVLIEFNAPRGDW